MGRGMEPRDEEEEVEEEEGEERERGAGEEVGLVAEEGRDTLVLAGSELAGVKGACGAEEGAGGASGAPTPSDCCS